MNCYMIRDSDLGSYDFSIYGMATSHEEIQNILNFHRDNAFTEDEIPVDCQLTSENFDELESTGRTVKDIDKYNAIIIERFQMNRYDRKFQ